MVVMLPCLSDRDRSGFDYTWHFAAIDAFIVIIAVITLDDLCEVSFIDSNR